MSEEEIKAIDWQAIKKSIKISLIWYVLILGGWWLMGIYPQFIFSLEGQLIIAGFSGFVGFLQSKSQ
jgi:hypothetical protein